MNDKFAQRLRRDVRSARSIDVSRTAFVAPPATLNPKPNKGSPLILMPPEIRNEVYHYLLPKVTNLRNVTGLLCAYKQVHQELPSMIVVRSRPVFDNVVHKNIALYQSTDPTAEPFALISTSRI
jgi:hypothetical protein